MIYVMKGDITGLDFDLIVNPANTQLLPSTGVNLDIYRAAGKGMLHELLPYAPIEEGRAILSGSYGLPCRKVIHAIGPAYNFGLDDEQELLAACYWNSMALAYDMLRNQSRPKLSIAFPEISTGPYGFPAAEACHIAIRTIQRLFREYPEAQGIDVWFVLRDEASYMLYKKELKTGSPRFPDARPIRRLRKNPLTENPEKEKQDSSVLKKDSGSEIQERSARMTKAPDLEDFNRDLEEVLSALSRTYGASASVSPKNNEEKEESGQSAADQSEEKEKKEQETKEKLSRKKRNGS